MIQVLRPECSAAGFSFCTSSALSRGSAVGAPGIFLCQLIKCNHNHSAPGLFVSRTFDNSWSVVSKQFPHGAELILIASSSFVCFQQYFGNKDNTTLSFLCETDQWTWTHLLVSPTETVGWHLIIHTVLHEPLEPIDTHIQKMADWTQGFCLWNSPSEDLDRILMLNLSHFMTSNTFLSLQL